MAAHEFRQEAFVTAARPPAWGFLAMFLALVIPCVAVLAGFSLHQAPVQGDLTRIGGYSENRYGWTAEHERFVPPLVSTVYDRPYDVVIVGDSYSVHAAGGQTDLGAYWTNHFAGLSGLSVVVINVQLMTLRDVMEHPIYKQSPPRLVILEMVERYLMRNLEIQPALWVGEGFDGCPVPGPWPRVELGRPLDVQPVAWERGTAPEFNFARAVDVMWKSAWRRLAGINRSEVYSLPLDRASFFSNRGADRLLVYDDEFIAPDWPRARIDASLCRLRAIQSQIEADGRTAFLFMAPPNKLTVYNPHVTDHRYRDISRLGAIYADPALRQVRLLEPMREALRCGAVDLYLPNDTHWGSPGHVVAAHAALERLGGTPPKSPHRC